MTKIYLVVFQDEDGKAWDFEVFTNKKKAEQYSRYWDAIMKKDPAFKGDITIIFEKYITNKDWTKEANKAEMELLPY